jgi:class 3 adenylate cyclase
VIEVEKPSVSQFMGNWERSAPNVARDSSGAVDSGLRAIMFTDLAGSTQVSTRDGDAKAMELLAGHDRIVRGALEENRGREVKHTGDGIFASFDHVSSAVGCALRIQHEFGEPRVHENSDEGRLRVGISVGEPVSQNDDLFGAVVNLAARICGHAQPGQILVSSAVRELSVGKSFEFVDQGSIALQGFDEPVKVFEVPTAISA